MHRGRSLRRKTSNQREKQIRQSGLYMSMALPPIALMGVVSVTPEKNKLKYAIRFGFKATNNETKYEAMLTGLRLAHTLGVKKVEVNNESQLVVGQVQGEYKAKDGRMKQNLTMVVKEKSRLRHFNIQRVPQG